MPLNYALEMIKVVDFMYVHVTAIITGWGYPPLHMEL